MTMGNFTAIAKVKWFFDEDSVVDYIAITNVANFTEAMQRVEASYEDDIESIHIEMIDNNFCPLTEEMAKKIVEGAV